MSRPFTLSSFNNLLKSLSRSGASRASLSIFLDFDGTLTPVAGHPDDAELSASMRGTLIALNKRYPVAIVSGRGLTDLKEKVRVKGLTYVGNHGMEMSSGDFSFIYDIGPVESAAIGEIAEKAQKLAASYDGSVIEEKGLTLSVHYRLLKGHKKPPFLKRLDALLGPFHRKGLIKKTYGKGLVEIRPTADWDKGSALDWLMGRSIFKGTIPLYVGDDETDEDAFKALKGRGLSIFVGKKKSVADLYLPKQSEVEAVLRYLT